MYIMSREHFLWKHSKNGWLFYFLVEAFHFIQEIAQGSTRVQWHCLWKASLSSLYVSKLTFFLRSINEIPSNTFRIDRKKNNELKHVCAHISRVLIIIFWKLRYHDKIVSNPWHNWDASVEIFDSNDEYRVFIHYL